jgi:hypothetical protein
MKALADEVATITAKLKSLETLVVFNNQLAEARPSYAAMGGLLMRTIAIFHQHTRKL